MNTTEYNHALAMLLDLPESLASRYQWLQSTCGLKSLDKFLGAKIREPFYWSGLHVSELLREESADEFLIKLLDDLKAGLVIPLCDVDSYYANNKRWPKGMLISAGKVIDVW